MPRNRDYILARIGETANEPASFFDYIRRYWQGLTVQEIKRRLPGYDFAGELDALALAISEEIN